MRSARLEADLEAEVGSDRTRVLADGRLEPQVIEARRSQVRGQTVQALDDGIGPLRQLRHPSGDTEALVDLPLQQAEPEAQRRQGLTRLVVKLPGDVAPLAFLRVDEAARERLASARSTACICSKRMAFSTATEAWDDIASASLTCSR